MKKFNNNDKDNILPLIDRNSTGSVYINKSDFSSVAGSRSSHDFQLPGGSTRSAIDGVGRDIGSGSMKSTKVKIEAAELFVVEENGPE